MDEKIRRTTSRQLSTNDSADLVTEAPLGAVRVVQPATKKTAEDKMAPMPMPRLDPTEEDKLFVPDKISERMSAMGQEPAPNAYSTSQQTTPVAAAKPSPADAELNRDAVVEPIFPKTAESKQVRRIPKADRNFDLKNIFTVHP